MYLNIGFGLVVLAAVVILGDRRRAQLLQRPPRVGRQRQPASRSPRTSCAIACDRGRGASGGGPADQPRRRPPATSPTAQAEQQSQFVEQQRQQLVADLARAHHRYPDPGRPRRRRRASRSPTPTSTRGSSRRRRPPRRATPGSSKSPRRSATARPSRRPRRSRPRSTKIDTALRDIQGGKTWDEVAKTVSTDASTAPQAGDLGWLGLKDGGSGRGVRRGLFAAEVEHADRGRRRRGRHLPDRPGHRDRARGRQRGLHRQPRQRRRSISRSTAVVVRGDVVRQKLEDKVVADATQGRPAARGQPDLPVPGDRRPAGRGREGPPHPVFAQGQPRRDAQSGDDPSGRSVLGAGQGRRGRGLRQAPGRRHPVRRHRPRGERRGERPRSHRHRVACWAPTSAPTAATSSRSRGRSWPPRRPTASSSADQDRVRVPHRPGHQPRAGPGQDQDPDRWWRRLREAGPGRLGRPRGEPGRRPRLDRQGPARRGEDGRDLRDSDRQDVGRRDDRGRRPVPVPRRRRKRNGHPRAVSSKRSARRRSPTGTRRRRRPSRWSAIPTS